MAVGMLSNNDALKSGAIGLNAQIKKLRSTLSANRLWSLALKVAMKLAFVFLLQLVSVNLAFAAPLTYQGCLSDSANSYQVGGWCFYFYYNSSWPLSWPPQSTAETICHPHGTLAVGVTNKALQIILTKILNAQTPAYLLARMAMTKNTSYASGWQWSGIYPDGSHQTAQAILPASLWAPGEPGYAASGAIAVMETTAVIGKTYGLYNVVPNITNGFYTFNYAVGVLCQFAQKQWSYTKKGTGRFPVTYQIEKATRTRLQCIIKCHSSKLCVSLAYSQTISDCQLYTVSPDDPTFTSLVTPDSGYEFHVRDGMVY